MVQNSILFSFVFLISKSFGLNGIHHTFTHCALFATVYTFFCMLYFIFYIIFHSKFINHLLIILFYIDYPYNYFPYFYMYYLIIYYIFSLLNFFLIIMDSFHHVTMLFSAFSKVLI